MQKLDQACVNTLRFLAADQVEKAKSGHPGFPLGTAPLMHTIWDRFMSYNPANPEWFNRDRFILSPGHGSALMYAMLHVAGYDLPMEELKNFRQWGSKTAGHPERGLTPGVDVSTGPLGHGFAMGVGFAMAEAMLAARYNKPDFPVVDHYTFGITSDGKVFGCNYGWDAKRAAMKVIPVIGGVVGGAVNGAFIRDIGWAARRAFQERWLKENKKIELEC